MHWYLCVIYNYILGTVTSGLPRPSRTRRQEQETHRDDEMFLKINIPLLGFCGFTPQRISPLAFELLTARSSQQVYTFFTNSKVWNAPKAALIFLIVATLFSRTSSVHSRYSPLHVIYLDTYYNHKRLYSAQPGVVAVWVEDTRPVSEASGGRVCAVQPRPAPGTSGGLTPVVSSGLQWSIRGHRHRVRSERTPDHAFLITIHQPAWAEVSHSYQCPL